MPAPKTVKTPHALQIWAVTVADTGHAWHARTYHHLIPSLVKEHASPLSPQGRPNRSLGEDFHPCSLFGEESSHRAHFSALRLITFSPQTDDRSPAIGHALK
jgi:hypothetical protein